MRRGINPIAIFVTIIVAIVALVLAFVIRNVFGQALGQMKDLVFWLVFVGVGGLGAVACGRFFNNR